MALRLAIIGYGHAGRGIHARLAKEAGFTVPVVVVSNQNRRQLAATDWPGARIVSKVSDLVPLKGLFDLAVIASPTSNHAENAAVLARAGIPFVLDKPMGIDVFESRAIIAEAAATNTPFTVFHNRRWDGEQLGLISALRSGQLGDIHTFERRWERWAATQKHRWREDDPLGGGVLLDLQVHLVDAAVQLFGPVHSVFATIRAINAIADDDTMLILEHEAGGGVARSKFPVISRLYASSVVGAPGPRTRALGTKGAFVVTSVPHDASAFEVVGGGRDAATAEREPRRDSGAHSSVAGAGATVAGATAAGGARGTSGSIRTASVTGSNSAVSANNPAGAECHHNAAWIVRGPEKFPVSLPHCQEIEFYRALPEWLAGETPPPVDPADALRTAIVLDAARVSAREHRAVEIKELLKPARALHAVH